MTSPTTAPVLAAKKTSGIKAKGPSQAPSAASSGALVGLALRAKGQLREGRYVPFGPFLALAAVVLVACGPGRVLQWTGLA